MKLIRIGIGELGASGTGGDVLRTYALGSCVAVIMIDPRRKAAGMLHVALPDSKLNPQMAQRTPGKFADTGIEVLLDEMARLGCEPRSMSVKLAGGALILDSDQFFEIGKKNILAVKKHLWRYKMGAIAEDIGGSISRTVSVDVANGRVTLSSPGKGDWDL